MTDERARVFVYGTLREGFSNPGRDVLTTHGTLLGEGTVQGVLYDLGSFPALVDAGEADERVVGDVYALDHEPSVALDRLDRYEGARGPNPLPYERRRRTVEMQDGTERGAWTYVWTGDVERSPRVEAGDWIAHVG